MSSVTKVSESEAFHQALTTRLEAERRQFLSTLDGCAVDQAALHKARSEAHTRSVEISELQKALSEAHLHIFEERERLLKVYAGTLYQFHLLFLCQYANAQIHFFYFISILFCRV